MTASDVQATFCATLVDEWIRRGVRHAVVAPGSRSTPVAVALTGRSELAIHVVHDERAAAFVALGIGLSGMPAILLCTSGTAAANFHPAVVEAGLSDVPMLVVTADRPPELRGVGAPQTIDQTELFGRSVRWFHDPGVADAAAAPSWRSLARRVFESSRDGPVHLNVPFREPLLGTPSELPPELPTGTVDVADMRVELDPMLVALIRRDRGVIVAGGRSGCRPDQVSALAAASGWPVLADPLSGCRRLETAVTAFDGILRHHGFADDHAPGLVVRVGRPPASKVLSSWIAASSAPVLQIGGPGVIDPDHNVAAAIPATAIGAFTELLASGPRTAPSSWSTEWLAASERAESVIDKVLDDLDALSEPGVARVLATSRPADATFVVASSMPVRDLEWFGGREAVAHANRGANGIDGVVSTALGQALLGAPTLALVGDVAFLHDGGALTALTRRGADLRVVVVDNDGGGIFSFLPQAEILATESFEALFGTPHGTDIVAVATAHGIDAATVSTRADLAARVGQRGPTVTRVATDRTGNVAVHSAINAAIVAALA